MRKIILSLALLGGVAFANIASPVVKNAVNNTSQKFYEELIYKIDRTQTENYLVSIYLTAKDYADILYKLKGNYLITTEQKDIQTIFTSEEFNKLLTENLKNKYLQDVSMKIAAYHEAGHLLIFSFLNEPQYKEFIDSITVILNSQKFEGPGSRAAVYFNSLENEDAKYVDIYLMDLLAGMASEEIIFNQHYTGSTSDLDKWYENALLIIKVFPKYVKANRYVDLSKYSMIPNTPLQITQNNQEIERFKEHQFKLVKEFINKNRKLLDEVAAILLEKNSLSNNEVKEIYKKVKF